MGKRELLIAVCFVALGVVAFSIFAPPPKPGERSFSLSRLFTNIKTELRRNSAQAQFTVTGTVKVPATVQELRLDPGRGVALTITGEDRKDIEYDMPVDSTGPDEAVALTAAKATKIFSDDLGMALLLQIKYPDEGSQRASLNLRVPAGLAVRVDTGTRLKVKGVASIEFTNAAGDTIVDAVAGVVGGTHRNGDLTVTKSGAIKLTLIGSRASFREISTSVTIATRNGGDCEVISSHGPLEFTGVNTDLLVSQHDGPIQIGGEGGTVKVRNPGRETKIDMRRTEVEVELTAAVALTALTTDEQLRVVLDGPPAVTLDASVSQGGHVQAQDFGLVPESDGRASKLSHVFGAGTARLILRNSRGDIVIGKRK